MNEVTTEMLLAAMDKAVEVGLIPNYTVEPIPMEKVLKIAYVMKSILEAAMKEYKDE